MVASPLTPMAATRGRRGIWPPLFNGLCLWLKRKILKITMCYKALNRKQRPAFWMAGLMDCWKLSNLTGAFSMALSDFTIKKRGTHWQGPPWVLTWHNKIQSTWRQWTLISGLYGSTNVSSWQNRMGRTKMPTLLIPRDRLFGLCIRKQPLMGRCVNMIWLGYPAWCMAVDRNINMLERAGRKDALYYSLTLLRKENKNNPPSKSKKTPQKVKWPGCLNSLWKKLGQQVQPSQHQEKQEKQTSIQKTASFLKLLKCPCVILSVMLWPVSCGDIANNIWPWSTALI